MNKEDKIAHFKEMSAELQKWSLKLNELMKCSLNKSDSGHSHQVVKILMTQEFANQWLKGSQELNGVNFKIAETNYKLFKLLSGMEMVEKTEQQIKELKNDYN